MTEDNGRPKGRKSAVNDADSMMVCWFPICQADTSLGTTLSWNTANKVVSLGTLADWSLIGQPRDARLLCKIFSLTLTAINTTRYLRSVGL